MVEPMEYSPPPDHHQDVASHGLIDLANRIASPLNRLEGCGFSPGIEIIATG